MTILNNLPFEVALPKDEIELEELISKVASFFQQMTAADCSFICDSNRGMLSLGDKIREKYQVQLTSSEEGVKVNKSESKGSHLSRIK